MGQALVTGATSGIGRAIAIALKGAGHEVVAVGRRGEALAALEREHGIAGRRADLADRKAARAALAGLAPDILVNNAGVMPPLAHFCDTDEDEIDRALSRM